jgi:hypothetical protein
LISITDIKQHQKQIGIDIHLPMGPQEGEEWVQRGPDGFHSLAQSFSVASAAPGGACSC